LMGRSLVANGWGMQQVGRLSHCQRLRGGGGVDYGSNHVGRSRRRGMSEKKEVSIERIGLGTDLKALSAENHTGFINREVITRSRKQGKGPGVLEKVVYLGRKLLASLGKTWGGDIKKAFSRCGTTWVTHCWGVASPKVGDF